MNPNVNYGLCLTTMYQCCFMDFKKYTTLMWDVLAGKMRDRVMNVGTLSTFPSIFCKPKMALKNKAH